MTLTIIGAAILGAAVVGIAVFFLCADVILGLRHRGEAAEAPCSCPWCDDIPGADEACALTRPRPLETVPAHPDPSLIDREREMAGTTAARLAIRIDLRSNR